MPVSCVLEQAAVEISILSVHHDDGKDVRLPLGVKAFPHLKRELKESLIEPKHYTSCVALLNIPQARVAWVITI